MSKQKRHDHEEVAFLQRKKAKRDAINALDNFPVLKQMMQPLIPYFNLENIIELCVNKPGEIWIETYEGWTRRTDPNLTEKALYQFCEEIATAKGQKFSRYIPLLSTQIPGYGYRLQALGGSVTEHQIALSIRVGAMRLYPLDSYFQSGDDCDDTGTEKQINPELMTNDLLFLEHCMSVGRTILVSGGTGSGKTSFGNRLLTLVPMDQRMVVLEDTQEFSIPQPNHVRLLKSKTSSDIAGLTYRDLINATMRLRPDRIFMGEIDVENTFPFLRTINTGHSGCLSTIHANDAESAIDALVQNVKLSGFGGAGSDDVRQYVDQAIDVIVHVEKVRGSKTGRRHVNLHCIKERSLLL